MLGLSGMLECRLCFEILLLLKASCLSLEINEFRCYEPKIEESERLGVVAQWQSTGSSNQRSPPGNCWPFFSLSSIFAS